MGCMADTLGAAAVICRSTSMPSCQRPALRYSAAVSWAVALRREQRLFSRVCIHHPEIALFGGNFVQDQKFLPIRRPIQRLPASTVELGQHVIALRIGWIHHPNVHVIAIAPRRAVRDPFASACPHHSNIARFPVSQKRDIAAVYVISIKLIKLSAANILTENEEVP